jgi:hypothetical protein
VVLAQGNPAPATVVVPTERRALYANLGLDPSTQTVVEYARQQPRTFVRGLWAKARFTLGWFESSLAAAGTSWLYIATWLLAVLGVAMLPWTRTAMPRSAALVGALVALSHFAVLVVFLPYVYGDRMIVPLYVLLVPYAALPMLACARAAAATAGTRSVFALWLLAAVAAVAQLAGWATRLDLTTLAVAALVAGLCAIGLPDVRMPTALAASAYAVALLVWLLRRPLADTAAAARFEWLFLALALFSSVLVADRHTRAASGVLVLMAVALASIAVVLRVQWGALLRDAFTWPPAFDPLAAIGAAAGLVTALGAAANRRARRAGVAFYIGAAALALGAVLCVGLPPNASRALLRGQIAAYGVAGAIAYSAVWAAGWWPSPHAPLSGRVKQGALLGAFVAVLFGVDLAGAGAAVPIAAGLTFGAVRADRA